MQPLWSHLLWCCGPGRRQLPVHCPPRRPSSPDSSPSRWCPHQNLRCRVSCPTSLSHPAHLFSYQPCFHSKPFYSAPGPSQTGPAPSSSAFSPDVLRVPLTGSVPFVIKHLESCTTAHRGWVNSVSLPHPVLPRLLVTLMSFASLKRLLLNCVCLPPASAHWAFFPGPVSFPLTHSFNNYACSNYYVAGMRMKKKSFLHVAYILWGGWVGRKE